METKPKNLKELEVIDLETDELREWLLQWARYYQSVAKQEKDNGNPEWDNDLTGKLEAIREMLGITASDFLPMLER